MHKTILDEIIARKHVEVADAKSRLSLSGLKAFCETAQPEFGLTSALKGENGPYIIAECKKRSPSKGLLKEDYDPISQATEYVAGGAAAISVLTDTDYFGGELSHLQSITQAVSLPVLRKDFIIDEYQIYEARRYGAASFLLLAGVLDSAQLQYFIEIGRELGMEPLVETHNDQEVDIALRTDAKIIGINNRNLRTMTVDFEHALHTATKIRERDAERILVCESGVGSRAQIDAAMAVHMHSFLVGEYLMRADDPRKALLALCNPK